MQNYIRRRGCYVFVIAHVYHHHYIVAVLVHTQIYAKNTPSSVFFKGDIKEGYYTHTVSQHPIAVATSSIIMLCLSVFILLDFKKTSFRPASISRCSLLFKDPPSKTADKCCSGFQALQFLTSVYKLFSNADEVNRTPEQSLGTEILHCNFFTCYYGIDL